MVEYNHPVKFFPSIFRSSYLAILIGFIGGYVGTLIHLPLPWLLGSLFANLIIAFTRLKITFSNKLLNPIFLLIGIILGGTLNVTLLHKVHLWFFSSLMMVLYVLLSTYIVYLYFYKFAKFSKSTSIFSSLPGALAPISAAILEMKNFTEHKSVILIQATRVIFIVGLLPIIFFYERGVIDIGGFGFTNEYDFKYFGEILFIVLLCSIGAILIKKFKIPSATLLSGMLISGTFYTFEIIDARFPDLFINIAFVFLGTALGSRLNGLKLAELGKYLFHGIIMSILLIILSGLFSYLLSFIDGFDFLPTFLSFTPGGIHEMIIISIAYDIDPIFVSYHHFLRIFLIVFSLPLLMKLFEIKKEG